MINLNEIKNIACPHCKDIKIIDFFMFPSIKEVGTCHCRYIGNRCRYIGNRWDEDDICFAIPPDYWANYNLNDDKFFAGEIDTTPSKSILRIYDYNLDDILDIFPFTKHESTLTVIPYHDLLNLIKQQLKLKCLK